MANLELSESIDDIVLKFISFCKKIRKSRNNNIHLSSEKQELLNEEIEKIKKNIEKLAKQATAIFDDKNHTKTLMLAINEYLLHFAQLAIVGHRSPNTLEKWIGRKVFCKKKAIVVILDIYGTS